MRNDIRYRLFGLALVIGGTFLLQQTILHTLNWLFNLIYGKGLWNFDPVFVIINFMGLLLVVWGIVVMTINMETLRTIAYQKRIDDYN